MPSAATTSFCGKGETISALSAPRVQTGMLNGSTWTLAKPIAFSLRDRPVAGARLGLGRGEPLADLGGQPFGDVPGIMVVGERIVAQRGDLGIGDDGRRQGGDRLLREGRGGGSERGRRRDAVSWRRRLDRDSAPSHRASIDQIRASSIKAAASGRLAGGSNRSRAQRELGLAQAVFLRRRSRSACAAGRPTGLARASG